MYVDIVVRYDFCVVRSFIYCGGYGWSLGSGGDESGCGVGRYG